jgi:hypothetical protein
MAPLLLLAVAGAGAAGLGYCYYRGACARHAKHEVKEDVTRWEAEGGNVPEVDTPTPQVKPEASFPAGATDIRH